MSNQLREAHKRKQEAHPRQQFARSALIKHLNSKDRTPEQVYGHASAEYVTLLRCTDVQTRTGLSRSSVYARMNPSDPAYDENFPVPLNISAKGGVSNRWIASEVDAWIANLPRARAFFRQGADHA